MSLFLKVSFVTLKKIRKFFQIIKNRKKDYELSSEEEKQGKLVEIESNKVGKIG